MKRLVLVSLITVIMDDEQPSTSGGAYSDNARRMMSLMGWREGKGLGKKEDGRKDPVQVAVKKDRKGGMRDMIKEGNTDFLY